ILGRGTPRPVIGVVRDFHVTSLHTAVRPQVLLIERGWSGWFTSILVRIAPGDVPGTLAYVEKTWDALTGGLDFLALEYSFLDEKVERQYKAEARLQTIFGFFSTLAIVIACLGVFGLAAFMAERRTKEIGIRKVLGATAGSIVVLLSKDLVRLVVLAVIVASPLVYLAMRRWLEGFAYRIEFGVGVLVLAGVLALLIALLTVSYHSVKASQANPVESLRYE
ncbi:MAG: ABC transporter permease, partial [Pseudomonadales bacterium]